MFAQTHRSASYSNRFSMRQHRGLSPIVTPLNELDQFDIRTPLSHTSSGDGLKLSEVLRMLDEEDERCVFVVRKISKLGYQAYDTLVSFFGLFGPVKTILLLPSRGKGDARLRPASMGFVVMSHMDDCSRVCELKSIRVDHVDVSVQKFKRNTKVEVLEQGYNITHAYVPPDVIGNSGSSSPGRNKGDSPCSSGPVVTLAEVEALAGEMLHNLRL